MSATNINVLGLIGKPHANQIWDGELLASEMQDIFLAQGRVEVVLSGLGQISREFLEASWGKFLWRAPSLPAAECRCQNTIFLCQGESRHLRYLIHSIGREALHRQELRHFQTHV